MTLAEVSSAIGWHPRTDLASSTSAWQSSLCLYCYRRHNADNDLDGKDVVVSANEGLGVSDSDGLEVDQLPRLHDVSLKSCG